MTAEENAGIDPLNWTHPWPLRRSRLATLAEQSGLSTADLRRYLKAEIAKRPRGQDVVAAETDT